MIDKNLLFNFLNDLKENNNREWFQDNQSRYKVFKENYLQLTSEFLNQLAQKDDRLKNLEAKKCMFRINRDIRFSKDKSPYKTNIGMWFTIHPNSKNSPGYYVHLETNNSFLAGGIYCPEALELKKIRNEIAYFHEDLTSILENKNFKNSFKGLDIDANNVLKNAPKGFEKDHIALELLKFKSFTATHQLSNNQVLDSEFVTQSSEKLIQLQPLNNFLLRALLD